MKHAKFAALAATLAALPVQAELLNPGADMELGETGKPVPGWMLTLNRIDRNLLKTQPDTFFTTETVLEKGRGRVLLVPYRPGMYDLSLICGEMSVPADGEVEVAFDAKVGKPVGADQPNIRLSADFRCYAPLNIKPAPNWSHKSYPVLGGFSTTPATEWKHFSRKVKVINVGTAYVMTLQIRPTDGKALNAPLYIDNFRMTFLNGKNDYPEEASIVPDHAEAHYFKDETMNFRITARLNANAEAVKTELVFVSVHDNAVRKVLPVTLKKDGEAPQNGLTRYTGAIAVPADQFGAFKLKLRRNGKEIASFGDVSVLHQPVDHKRFSPGWSIGMNEHSNIIYNGYQNATHTTYFGRYSSWSSVGRIARLAGMRNVRIWGRWVLIEREPGKFSPDVISSAINEYYKNGVEPFFCIAAGMGLLFRDKGPNGETADYPLFYYGKYIKKYPRPGIVMLDAPLDVYGRYLDYCIRTWGDKVKIWEMFNEPGDPVMGPQQYLKYLKYTYKVLKEKSKDYLLLGNGNTCDVGYDKGWCRRLSEADPDYVDYVDGIAFHPYNNSSDYEKNIYGLYSAHIKELRSTLKKQKPLCNTECYYIVGARNPQSAINTQERIPAEAVQRHYLDGMLNDVRLAAAPNGNTSLLTYDPSSTGMRVMSEMAVATNALSFMLKDMEKLDPVPLNPFMRAGIFKSADRKQGVGFVYDLRPSGSTVKPGSESGLQFFDLFGNRIAKADGTTLSYEPLYIKGTPERIAEFFKSVRFIPKQSCRVFGRVLGGRLYLTALNSFGQPGTIMTKFAPETGLPNIQFAFKDADDDSTVSFPLPANRQLTYRVESNGAELGSGKVEMTASVPEFTIPAAENEAKELTLSRGTKAKVWSDGTSLKIRTNVKAAKVTPADGESLWEGDAVELFIDPAPFSKPDKEVIISTNPLNCFQYVFAAAPSKTGSSVLAISRTDKAFKTNAAVKQTRTADGYSLEISIPWTEIRPAYDGVIGLEIEVARPGETGWKESLSGVKAFAFKVRSHYPLFRLQTKAAVRNGSFTKGEYGEADGWFYTPQSNSCRIEMVPKSGFNGGNAVVLNSTKASPGSGQQGISQPVAVPEWATGMKVSALVEMSSCTTASRQFNSWRPQGFYLGLSSRDMSHILHREFSAPFGWTLLQFYAPIEKQDRHPRVECGLRQAFGNLKISEIQVNFIK